MSLAYRTNIAVGAENGVNDNSERDDPPPVSESNHDGDNYNMHRHGPYAERARHFQETVLDRHAARRFESQNNAIPHEILSNILALTQRTASGYNLQPWVAIVVTDEEQKKDLWHACLHQRQILDASALVVFAANHNALEFEPLARKMSLENGHYSEQYADIAHRYSNLLLDTGPCMIKQLAKFVVSSGISIFRPMMTVPMNIKAYVWKQTMMAVQTFLLACSSHGLATSPMEGIDERRVRNVVHLPPHFSIPCVVAVGYEAEKRATNVRSPRVPPEMQFFTERYGDSVSNVMSFNDPPTDAKGNIVREGAEGDESKEPSGPLSDRIEEQQDTTT